MRPIPKVSGALKATNDSQPKSHGGCTTCKIRKVKCDESRPICRRCESTGRRCDGYQPMQSLGLSLLNSPKELRSYHYFWNRVLPLLSGHYDYLFWGIWIRQACFRDLAIQHAIIAVGAMHQSIASRLLADTWTATQLNRFAIQQYNKSIQYLSGDTFPTPKIEIVLASCIVFITFENLCGRNDQAFKHLQSGLAILQSWKTTTISETLVKEEYLVPIYTRGYGHEASADLSKPFRDLQGARKCLQMHLDSIYSAISSSTILGSQQRLDADIICAGSILAEWNANFAKLDNSRDLEQKRAGILLKLQFETASILLASISFQDECDVDKYHDTFKIIVDLCEQLVALESTMVGNDISDPKVFTYGFDLNILPPLNITAFKCRDPTIRRAAIKLMGAANRYEGLWSGKTSALLAQKTMEIEEAGFDVTTCTDIPQKSRVKLVGLSYNPESQLPTSRDAAFEPSTEPYYTLHWLRVVSSNIGTELVNGSLPVPPEDVSSPWGPGSHPWHMDLQYDPQWSQWKISDQSQDLLSDRAEEKPISKLSRTTEQSRSNQVSPSSTSRTPPPPQAPAHATRNSGTDQTRQRQQVNLFWDHWRLRTISVRHGRAMAVEMEKEATRGGRSYGDAKRTDDSGTQPSHLLISLP